MKYIILLLVISASCLAQTKVTAYRLVNEDDDGPCSVKEYPKMYKRHNFVGFYAHVTAESNDEVLAGRLLTIKKESKKWKSIGFNCNDGVIGGDMIHNMLVIEYKGKNDTVFTTRGNRYIVFPDDNIAYADAKEELNNSLTGIIKEFSEHDFDKDLSGMFMGRRDSISSGKVLYKGKNLYGCSKERFEREYGILTFMGEMDVYGKTVEAYSFKGDLYYFSGKGLLTKVEILTINSDWEFDGLTIESNQQSLQEKYPVSMSFNVIEHVRFEDYKKENLHWLSLKEDKGSINFWIRDDKLNRFEILFYNFEL